MTSERAGPSWTTVEDLRLQVRRLWERGAILSDIASGGELFPKRLVLRTPTSVELRDHFESARSWSVSLRSAPHLHLTARESRHRVFGVNSLPREARVDTPEDAAAMIGKRRELERFRKLLGVVGDRQPALLPWLARKPIRALRLGSDWGGLLNILQWLEENARPGIYVRQMDVAGVDTKFVDKHRSVLAELLDIVLPVESIDPTQTGATRFASRYGFKSKPERVRIRILDPKCALLPWRDDEGGQDLTLSATRFSTLQTPASRAIITENEINFLALPPMERTIAIFGSGYGFDAVSQARWLMRCSLHYWGDIDTHGFAILDELRGHFGTVNSFLMDRKTFLAFEAFWVSEPSPTYRRLRRLTRPEALLYEDLRNDTFGASLRLEQERIRFGWVQDALAALPSPASPESQVPAGPDFRADRP